jgi:NADPH-dependent 2,4-dienoyl-CoA reductase/sulfur reductase-like enzyme
MVAIARALLADAEWPNKAEKGNLEDILPCVGDTQCLVRVGGLNQPIRCLINPCVGRDKEMALVPCNKSKRVLVAGGGPAGLEAARVAALRGHQVFLVEKEAKLGGQLLLASFPPMKQEYTLAVQYLSNQIYKAGIQVQLNQEVSLDTVSSFRPDVVILATGGLPLIPRNLPGINGQNVISAWEVLSGKIFPGPNVVILGGGKVGCETADYLANIENDRNPSRNNVTIVDKMDNIVLDDLSPYRTLLIRRLHSKGVRILTNAEVLEILPDGIKYRENGNNRALIGMDHIVVSMGIISQNTLLRELKENSIPAFVIGDAKEPRDALEAIKEGSEIARKI